MKKCIIFLIFVLFSVLTFSQTTVTLQDQCNCEVLKGTAVNTPGVTTPSGADAGDIYVNTTTGTIFFWDGDSWELTSDDNQQLQSFTLDGLTNELTLTLEDGGSVNVDLSSLSDTLTDTNTTVVSFEIDATNTNLVITDSDTNTFSVALVDLANLINTDTQYTAGNGLNLDGSNEFTAVASPDANNALDVRANGIYATDTDDQNAGEVGFDDTTATLGETDVQGAIEALAGRTDNDTQYTAGNGLNLDGSNEFTAVASPDANNALDVRANGIYATDTDDQNAGEVGFDDTTATLGETDVQGAIEALAGRTDNDTQYTAGNGLNLDGSNEFTAVASPDANNALDVRANGIYATDTDDQNAGEVGFDDTTATLGETDVQGAIEALAGRTDNDTQYTAGGGLDLTGTVFSADVSSTAGNALTIDANGLYVPDTDNDTQYTAGNGLNLDGSNEFTAVASPDANNALDVRANGIYATDTDDQNAGEVSFDDTTATLGETDVQGAIEALAGRTDNDTQYTAGNGLNLDGSNEFTAVASPDANNALDVRANGIYATDTDDQNAGEVGFDDTTATLGETDVQGAIEALAGRADNDTQYTAGNGLNLDGSNEFTAVASPDANNALDVRANGIYATDTDDQNAGEVGFDDTTATLGETDVQGAIEALAGRTDNDTQYTAGNGLNLDGSNEFTAVASPDANNALDVRANGIYATDDQNAGEVGFDDTTATLGETDVQGAIEALAGRTDNDTQYTAGNGLNLDGSNEFTAVASPDANNALDVRANGIYVTDDQNAEEVDILDTGGNFTSDNVEDVLEEIDSRIDALVLAGGSDGNDFVTGGSLSGTNLTLNIPNQIDPIINLSALQDGTGTDNQTAGEVGFDDTTATLGETDVQGAIEALAGRADNDTQYTAGGGLDLTGTVFSADVSSTAGNALTIDANGLYVPDTDNDTQYTAGNGLNLDGSNEFTAVASPDANNALDVRANGIYATDTDDQNAGEVSFDDTTAALGETDVQGAIEALAGRTDNDTQYTAGNGLNLDGSNEFTAVASPDANNALDVRANGIYATDTDDQNAGEVSFDDTTATLGETDVQGAIEALAGRTDNDTQYTAGNGLNLDGSNEFTAVASPDANNALDVRANGIYATDTDDQNAGEVSFDDTTATLGETDVQGAIEALAGRTDNDTQYTAGNGLNLDGSNEFTAVASPDANNALDVRANGIYATDTDDQNAGEVGFDDTTATLGETDVQGAIEALAGRTDNDTQYTAGNGLNLDGSNEFTAVASPDANNALDVRANGIYATDTDDQNAGEVGFDDTTATLGETDVQGAIEALAGRTDNDTQYTAGNGLNLDGSNEFTAVASPDANNALDVRANGIYATDDQNAGEVGFDDTTATLGETDVQGAIEALAGRTDNDTQYTAGNGLNLDGSNEFTAVASPDANNALDVRANGIYATDTDDQNAGEVGFDDTTATLGETDVQGAIEALAGRTDNDTQYTAGGGLDLTGTVFSADVSSTAGNALTIDANGLYVPDTDNDTQYTAGNGLNLDGSNEFTAVASPDANNALDVRANGIYATDTDDQNAGEVSFDDTTAALGETDVQGAIEALAGRTDNDTQYTAGNGLNLDGSNEFTAVASPDANNALDVRANGIYATDTDDQNAGEVGFDDTTATLGETDVQGAIEALAGRTDNDTQYTAGNGLNLDGSNEFTAVASPDANNALDVRANGIYATDTDDQNAGEVGFDDTTATLGETDVQGAIEALAGRTDNDTQYTAGNGLNLDGSNEFTAVASPDANNALDVRANGIYATDTDDQNAGEVGFDDTTATLGETDVQGAIEALAGRTDNDTQYTAGNGLNLDGSNEFTAVASPDANNALDVRANGIYATDTDDQNAGEVGFDDTTATLGETDVQGAIEALAGRADNDTQYTAGGGLDLTGTVFSADVSSTAGNALTIDANGLYVPDTDNDTQYTAGNGLNLDGSNEFTAVASPDANNALDVRANGIYATDTDDQNAGEVGFDDTTATLGETDVQGAIEALAGRTDNDTQYTAGGGLDLTGTVFSADVSSTAGNALTIDANGLYVPDTDNDTQYTAGNGLNLDGSNEFTAVASPDANNALDVRANGIYATDTDDQNAGEVSFDDTTATLGETDVQGAIEALAGRTDNDTQYTAGNGLNLDGSNEFTAVASPDANNALDVRANGIYATDDQNAGEVSFDDTTATLGETDVQGAIEALAGRTDNDTQYTAGNGLNLDGSNEFTAVASPDANNALDVRANGIYATDTDDQNAGEVGFDDTTATLGETDVQGAIEALAGRADNDTQYTAGGGLDLTGTVFSADVSSTAGNALTIDANGLYVPDTDNDTQYTAGNGLNLDGSNEFTAVASPDANNALDVRANGIYATDTDDQNAGEVGFDDTTATLGETDVQGAIEALAGRTDNDTQYTAGGGLDLTGTVFSADVSSTAGNALTIDANGLYVPDTDNDTQYTAGNGLNLDGSNEFTAVASPDANNALDVRANGIYATDTDDQNAGEVSFDDTTATLGETDVQGAIEALAGRTDNDTQYTAGNGLNLDGSNEFTAVASPDANNALDVRANGIYATDTDDQNAGEVGFDDTTATLGETDVQGAIEALAGRTDNDTQYTAGNGLNLDGSNEFTADISTNSGNALFFDGDGLFSTDNQTATEVNLDSPINVDGDGLIVNDGSVLGTPYEVNQTGISPTDPSTDTTLERTVEEAIQAMAPITSKAARVFYPPSIAVDASVNGTFSINLYDEYITQFATPTVASSGAPSAIPNYQPSELYYYVTFADPNVFGDGTTVQNMSIDANGVLSYQVFNQPADYNALINVVFVVK
ncbi:hypothetical protein ACOKFD_18890 [Flagellimonas sp. S174]|uniref:hypothetical protein n=1 Tax=Flagellimonas sp. S174 TaxID=3410790 RepID=UPI003BF6012B